MTSQNMIQKHDNMRQEVLHLSNITKLTEGPQISANRWYKNSGPLSLLLSPQNLTSFVLYNLPLDDPI